MYYQNFFTEPDSENQIFPDNPIYSQYNHPTQQIHPVKKQNQFYVSPPNFFSIQINDKSKIHPYNHSPKNNYQLSLTSQNINQPLFKKKQPRQVKNINTHNSIKQLYLRTSKGSKAETTELNINIKTLTKNFLIDSVRLREFNKVQAEKIELYQSSKANFITTQTLFGIQKVSDLCNDVKNEASKSQKIVNVQIKNDSNRIRKRCFQEYSSSKFIVSIFKAQKMAMKNKLTILKYVENVRLSPAFPGDLKKWKGRPIQ